MILDALILMVSGVLFILVKIFTLFSYVIPVQVFAASSEIIGYAQYLRGYVDIDTFFIVVGSYIHFMIILYSFKIIKWAYAHIPWFGKSEELPTMIETRTISSSYSADNRYMGQRRATSRRRKVVDTKK